MRRSSLRVLSILVALAVVWATPVLAQSTSTFATGFTTPTKLILAPGGALLVAEGGGFAANTGRVSIVERDGTARAFLSGLPSGVEPAGLPQGPAGLAIGPNGKVLYVAVSAGDVTVAGPAPGTEVPNPNAPSSPILSSILRVEVDGSVEDSAGGFELTLDDHFTISHGLPVILESSAGDTAVVTLVTDFRDLVRDPQIIARRFNPFGIALDPAQQVAWINDSSQNSIERVDLRTGRIQRLLELDPIPNPLPFGPPLLDPVPTSVRLLRGGEGGASLIVPLETGFPFPPGAAPVVRIDTDDRSATPFLTGFTNLLDVLAAPSQVNQARYFVVELSTDILSGAPGRLLLVDGPGATPQVLADTLFGPTSVAFDSTTHEAFVTEVFTGNVVRVTVP